MPGTKKKSRKKIVKQPDPQKLAQITREVDAFLDNVDKGAEKLGAKLNLDHPVVKRNRALIRQKFIDAALPSISK